MLRLALGLFCFHHGFLKIRAGGGTAWHPGLPASWQLLIAWGEFVAGVAILTGCHCRLAAVTILSISGGTTLWRHGWKVLQLPLPTLEPILTILLMALALLFLGGGGLVLGSPGAGTALAGKLLKKKMAA